MILYRTHTDNKKNCDKKPSKKTFTLENFKIMHAHRTLEEKRLIENVPLLNAEYLDQGKLLCTKGQWIVHLMIQKDDTVVIKNMIVLTIFSIDTYKANTVFKIPLEDKRYTEFVSAMVSAKGDLWVILKGGFEDMHFIISLHTGQITSQLNGTKLLDGISWREKLNPKVVEEYPQLKQFFIDLWQYNPETKTHGPKIDFIKRILMDDILIKQGIKVYVEDYFPLNQVCYAWKFIRSQFHFSPCALVFPDGEWLPIDLPSESKLSSFERYDKTIVVIDHKNLQIHEYNIVQ